MSHNTNSQLFVAAAVLWFRNEFQRVIFRLESALRCSDPSRVIEWRADTVTDFRNRVVPASAERLVRWDYRHPNVIFQDGFIPQYAPEPGNPLEDTYVDLSRYVNENAPSIFVGTARYYHQNGRNTRWTPRTIANRFEYEIFAFGGIDINLSLGSEHRYWNQREIAFPGGIRPEFIRTAREYDQDGRVVRIWVNGGFNISANGANHAPRLSELPEPVFGSQVPVVYWTGEELPDDHLHRELRDTSRQEDVMREEGIIRTDDLMCGTRPAHPTRACFQVPEHPEEAYFFADTRYIRINVMPGTRDDTVVLGPKNIIHEWPSLKRAGFAVVDAVLPSPSDNGEAYFFSGDWYALIRVIPGTTDDYIIGGEAKSISDNWPSLRRANFNTVDAVLPSPNGNGEAYFFSGDRYALIRVIPGTTDDYIIGGEAKSTSDNWPSLYSAAFY